MTPELRLWTLVLAAVAAVGCGAATGPSTPRDGGARTDVARDARTDGFVQPDGAGGGCSANDQCAMGEFCAGLGCGTPGSCAPQPNACDTTFDPVCGCDGVTYENPCLAAAVGIRPERTGPCDAFDGGPDGGFEGGFDGGLRECLNRDECGPDETCLRSGCGAAPGLCVPRPVSCPNIFDPVCGCDGRTYNNPCVPLSSGQPIAHPGACGADAGVDVARDAIVVDVARPDVPIADAGVCFDSASCGPQGYCAAPGCGARGVCVPRPVSCPGNFEPVCGCDGRTHENACLAAARGVGIAFGGSCNPPPDGGVDAGVDGFVPPDVSNPPCFANASCGRGGFCYAAGCGTPGQCVPRPPSCPDFFSPVCSCEGTTFANLCFAFQAGQRVAFNAACPVADAGRPDVPVVDAGPLTCASNFDCRFDSFCDGAACGSRGVCVQRPRACDPVLDPVCGCDGRTYGSRCEAALNGVRAQRSGTCGPVSDGGVRPDASVIDGGGPTDGGIGGQCLDDFDCGGPSQLCVRQIGLCAGAGVCVPRPPTCPSFVSPACGCDGRTYVNACFAVQNGVGITALGPCPPDA